MSEIIDSIEQDGVQYTLRDSDARTQINSIQNAINDTNKNVEILQQSIDNIDGIIASKIDSKTAELDRNITSLKQSNDADIEDLQEHKIKSGTSEELGHVKIISEDKETYTNDETFSAQKILDLPVKSHASTTTEYGIGNETQYGHVKLSKNYNYEAQDIGLSLLGAKELHKELSDKIVGTMTIPEPVDGKIIQYLGEDTSTFKKGYFYIGRKRYEEVVWELLFNGEGGGGEGASYLIDLRDVNLSSDIEDNSYLGYNKNENRWENKTFTNNDKSLTNLEDVKITSVAEGQVLTYNNSTKMWENKTPAAQDSIQFSKMPAPSEDYVNKIVQYIGTDDSYHTGYFYQCLKNKYSGRYYWDQISVSANVSKSRGYQCVEKTYSNAEGDRTYTSTEFQFALGRLNKISSDNVFMIGNGYGDYRSNSFSITWQGDIESSYGNINNYFSDEHKIGTWIDGSELYRCVSRTQPENSIIIEEKAVNYHNYNIYTYIKIIPEKENSIGIINPCENGIFIFRDKMFDKYYSDAFDGMTIYRFTPSFLLYYNQLERYTFSGEEIESYKIKKEIFIENVTDITFFSFNAIDFEYFKISNIEISLFKNENNNFNTYIGSLDLSNYNYSINSFNDLDINAKYKAILEIIPEDNWLDIDNSLLIDRFYFGFIRKNKISDIFYEVYFNAEVELEPDADFSKESYCVDLGSMYSGNIEYNGNIITIHSEANTDDISINITLKGVHTIKFSRDISCYIKDAHDDYVRPTNWDESWTYEEDEELWDGYFQGGYYLVEFTDDVNRFNIGDISYEDLRMIID